MRKIIITIFAVILCAAAPAARADVDVSNLTSTWGNGTMQTCQSDGNMPDSCIGSWGVTNQCASNSGSRIGEGTRRGNSGTKPDSMAVIMLVARQITANGAYFCPTQLQGNNSDKDWSHTDYYEPTGAAATNCFWLCKPGFSGTGCSLQGADPATVACNTNTIKRDNYNSVSFATSGDSISAGIPQFIYNQHNDCDSNAYEEHDMILAVSGFLPSGHGAMVSQVNFRAAKWQDTCNSWSCYASTAVVTTTGTPELLCMDGYTSNGTDCVAIAGGACEVHGTLSESDMRNGLSLSDDNGRECWKINTVDDYKTCVFGTTDTGDVGGLYDGF